MTNRSVGAALANALRQVNVAFSKLPSEKQAEVEIVYDEIDREIDVAMLHDETDRASHAVQEFKVHWLNKIERAK